MMTINLYTTILPITKLVKNRLRSGNPPYSVAVTRGNNDNQTLFVGTDGCSMMSVRVRILYADFHAKYAREKDDMQRPLEISTVDLIPLIRDAKKIRLDMHQKVRLAGDMRRLCLEVEDTTTRVNMITPSRHRTKELRDWFNQVVGDEWEGMKVLSVPWIGDEWRWMQPRIKWGIEWMKGPVTHIWFTPRKRMIMRSWRKGRLYQYIVMPIVPKK